MSYEQKKAAHSVSASSGSENQIEEAEKAKKEGNEHFKAKRYEWINQSAYIYIYIYIYICPMQFVKEY